MAYADTGNLNLSAQRLIELTDSDSVPGEVDEGVLARTLTESQAVVDSVLAASRSVPFPDNAVPPLINILTGWIWAYRLYRHREVMEIPKSIVDDYERAMMMLQQISDGVLIIDPADDKLGSVPRVRSSEPRGWTRRSGTRT